MPENPPEPSFADLFKNSQRPEVKVRTGDRVEGTVISIGNDSVFLDLGTRAEGLVKKDEFVVNGRLSVAVGDKVTVLVSGYRNDMFQCTRRLGGNARRGEEPGRDSAALAKLRDAFQARIPVEGKVKSVNKGGFEVVILGQRTFCPISQIEKGYCSSPEAHIDKTYTFMISQFEEEGRNIVVGRKELLRAEEQERARRRWDELAVGQVLEGTVTRLQEYGAFVDIGGVEGLLHVSEISHRRVDRVEEELSVGQKLNVAIIALDAEKRKISLSLKSQQADPWEEAEPKLAAGGEFPGTVVRLRPFGAFVELFPGVVGLLHVSRLGGERRVSHPKEALSIGDAVKVRILEFDREKKTLALTMEEPAQDFSAELDNLRKQQDDDLKSGPGSMASLLDSAMKKAPR